MIRAEIAIIGAGPAGCATAIHLSRSGHRVCLIEQNATPRRRPGEILSPETLTALEELGVKIDLSSNTSPGRIIAWGTSEPRDESFLFNPYGAGMHLSRETFDAILTKAAVEAGATVLAPTRLLTVERNGAHWHLRLVHSGKPRTVEAEYLVDASGRRASVARRLGAVRERVDKLVGLVAYLKRDAVTADPRMALESTDMGWWYCAPLSGEIWTAAFMTDSDLIPRDLSRAEYWRHCLETTTLIRQRLGHSSLMDAVMCVDASSAVLQPSEGEGWTAVGDAALSTDPLEGSGIGRAISAARMCARRIEAMSRGESVANSGDHSSEFAAYCAERNMRYRTERRWETSAFWQRRIGGGVARESNVL